MNAIKSIIFVGALVALLGAGGSDALFGKKKKEQPQVVTNYVPINQGPPAYYGAEPAYYPSHHGGHHGAHHGPHHGGHHLAHHGAGNHGAGGQQHGLGGGSAAAASASAGGAASASASAAGAPAPYYHEPHHEPHQHQVEHYYEPAEYYPYEHESHHAGHGGACVAPPCYGGLVQNFGVPAPKKHGLVSKLLHKGGGHGGAHGAHGAHGGYAPEYATQYY